jgi:hypothetical protein
MRSTSSHIQLPTSAAYCEVGECTLKPKAWEAKTYPGSLSVSVSDSCYVSCAKTKIKVILEYQEEGWLGRSQNKVLGVIFKYDPNKDTKTKIKEVSDKDILGRVEGNWQDKVYYTLGSQPFAKNPVRISPFIYVRTEILISCRKSSSSSISTRYFPYRRLSLPSKNSSPTNHVNSGKVSQMLLSTSSIHSPRHLSRRLKRRSGKALQIGRRRIRNGNHASSPVL